MRKGRGSIVLAAVAFVVLAAACSSDGDADAEAFDLTGRVVSVEPGAKPAEDPTGMDDIVGAIVVQTAQPADCETDANGVRVYLMADTSISPSSASDDLKRLRGKTVDVSGEVTKDGDACTVVADSVATQSAKKDEPESTDDSDSGDTGGTGDSSETSPPSATDDPLDGAGSITETDQTPSIAPDNPDDHGVVEPGDDNSGSN